ncbi:MAG TPA: hypothetical protein VGZ47_22435 [Gemmataceae bacterium]|nr:hypothetical protein [Gemmataceae bacterium]
MNRRDHWKAPAEDGGVLVDPPLERAEELLDINHKRLEASKFTFLGRPLSEIRAQIQNSVAVVGDAGLAALGSQRPHWPTAPIIASGHQPEFYHPGVWAKNFAVQGMAKRFGAAPLHVVIDSDTLKTTVIEIPIWGSEPERVKIESVAYDSWKGEEPLLGRPVRDLALFRGFAKQVQEKCAGWPFEPWVSKIWPEAIQAHDRLARRLTGKYDDDSPPTLAWCLTLPRLLLEHSWGCVNREQWLCLLDRQAFIGQILGDLPRFHAIYNDCLAAYRRKYHRRSASHPVPDLASDSDFFEAPFWWLHANANRRERLFVRSRMDRLDLRPGRNGRVITVPAKSPYVSPELAQLGVQLTTRALTTTMFLRLCVADLFIHGIGGAKYDDLTDDIIRRYFGIDPPEYMVVSGTLLLPFEDKLFPRFGCGTPRRKARDVLWNPQRYLEADDPAARELAAEKQHWIEQKPADSAGRRERFYQLQSLTLRLRKYVAELQQRAEEDLNRCEAEAAANKILTNREYAFVLYPEEKLRPFLTQFFK